MGGIGSGRYDYARTATVRESCRLVSDWFTEAIHAEGRVETTVSWGDVTIGVVVVRGAGEVGLEDGVDGGRRDLADGIRLIYTTDPNGEAVDRDYLVRFDYTEPNYGGVRPWFRCPECGTRRQKLCLPPGGYRFACRDCHDLGYVSSRQSGNAVFRAIDRYRDAFETADAEGRRPHPNDLLRPKRAPGRHREKFERQLEAVRQARREFDDAFREKWRQMADYAGIEP
jgi:hypothetical protein